MAITSVLDPVDPGAGDRSGSPRWLVGWLSRESEALLDPLVDELTEELPELASARDNPRAHIREGVRLHLDVLAARADDSALPAIIEKYARALARHDMVPLPVLLRTFEQLHARLWRRFVAALRSPAHFVPLDERAEAIEQTSAHLFDYFHAASAHTSSAYGAESTLMRHRAMSRRSDAVAAFLAGSLDSTETEQELGYRLNAVHVGYVAWVDSRSDLKRLDGVVAAAVEILRPVQHLGVPGDERSLHGWLTCHDDRWRRVVRARALPPGVHVAWGAPHEGPEGLRASHTDALEARRVSEAVGSAGSVLFDDVAVASLASRDLAAAAGFVARQLGPLVTGDRSATRLLETLRIYLDELASPTRTARRLHVHPNTVIKRLERIEASLGCAIDPASLSLRVAVELAPLVATAGR